MSTSVKITRYRFVKLREGFTFMEAEAEKDGKRYYVNISITPGEETDMEVYQDGCETWTYNCPVDEIDFENPEKNYEDIDAEDIIMQMVEKWNSSPHVAFTEMFECTEWTNW